MKDSLSGRLLQALTIALLAGALLALALPRMKASLRFLPVDQAIDHYYADRDIPSHRMVTLIEFARQAIDYHDHYRYHDGLSLLYYLRGIDIHTPALERREQYVRAELEAVEVVKRAPAQPQAWLRMATVRSILHDEPENVLAPWRMSVFTGRTHSTLVAPRIGVALPYLRFMDAETRGMLRDQILLCWDMKPGELVEVLAASDRQLAATRELLGNTAPAVLNELEARIEKNR